MASKQERMDILLDRKEYIKVMTRRGLPEVCAVYDNDTIATLKAQARKILIELQVIYKLPDLKMEYDRMGEFIQSLLEEVNRGEVNGKKN